MELSRLVRVLWSVLCGGECYGTLWFVQRAGRAGLSVMISFVRGRVLWHVMVCTEGGPCWSECYDQSCARESVITRYGLYRGRAVLVWVLWPVLCEGEYYGTLWFVQRAGGLLVSPRHSGQMAVLSKTWVRDSCTARLRLTQKYCLMQQIVRYCPVQKMLCSNAVDAVVQCNVCCIIIPMQ